MALTFLWKRGVCMFPITTWEKKASLLLERGSREPCIQINNCYVETMPCIDLAYWRLVTWQFTPFGLNKTNHKFPREIAESHCFQNKRIHKVHKTFLRAFSSLLVLDSFLLALNLQSLSFNKTPRPYNLLETSTWCLFLPEVSDI